MSGGALDYLYARVNDAADRIETYRYTEYLALANHLRRIANVLYDVEWVMSGDKTSPDDIEAIRTIITPSEILDVAIQRAVSAKQDLDRAIEIAQGCENEMQVMCGMLHHRWHKCCPEKCPKIRKEENI